MTMNEQEKALTFKEHWGGRATNGLLEFEHEATWNAARVGMIPADQAIRVPLEKDWPVEASEVKLVYCSAGSWGAGMKEIISIPRPAPAIPKWTPKVGDKVFLNNPIVIIIDQPGLFPVCVIEEAHNGRFVLKGIPNLAWHIDSLKPFDESKLGKTKWEDI